MEEAKYIKIIEVLTDKIDKLELENACKGYELTSLKKRLETTLEQIEVQCSCDVVAEEVKETR